MGEERTGVAEQAAVSPLPTTLNLVLNARTSVTIGAVSNIYGDVASSGPAGAVLFDIGAKQGYSYYNYNYVLANSVHIKPSAVVGHVYGNDLVIEGAVSAQSLGFDPAALPQVPAGAAVAPGNTKVNVDSGHVTQLCPGRYGAISVRSNATLNLNGGVYHVKQLALADGARLEPSEPVVILVSGSMTTGTGAVIRPFSTLVHPMSAADIRIEVGGNATIGPSSEVRAHLLVPRGQLTTGQSSKLYGAGWASTISIGTTSLVQGEGTFQAQTPEVPLPCDDNNVCTTDSCVGGGTTVGYCRNEPVEVGTSCTDGNFCNGAETCNSTGHCQAGTPEQAGTSCADDNACNGAETCNGYGSCVPGTPPAVNDRNACTADACDPATGVSHVPVPDGTACLGSGVCDAGACSIQGTVFSEDFYQYQGSYAQCSSWNAFRGALTGSSYSSVSMSGSLDLAGTTCNDPARATQICQALHSGTPLSMSCNGRIWSVGYCGGIELNADGAACQCTYGGSGHVVRPCIGNENWGGVGTSTCYGPSQTLTVVCQ